MPKGGLLGAAAVALLATAASAFPERLQLDRGALQHGELWRLWSGHLVHASRDHLVFDVGAACLLFTCLGSPLHAALRLVWLAPVISISILLVLPGLDYYYGLSGLLHAWAVAGAGEIWRREHGVRSRMAAAFCMATLLKATWETWTASATCSNGMDMGGPTAFAAHLVGAIAGLALFARSLPHTSTVRLRNSR